MRLKALFIIMDLLTILAYPLVFMDGKLRQLLKTTLFAFEPPGRAAAIPVRTNE